MSEINAKDVMALRNRTGLSMMECKKALTEVGGDIDAAEDYLRKQLKGKMEKRADRAAGEGRVEIAVAPDSSAAAIIELRAETDFTARNEDFISTARKLAGLILKTAGEGEVAPTPEMTALVDNIRITTGENISLARATRVAGGSGRSFGTYVHHDGKTGVLLVGSGGPAAEALRQVCMHVTAAVPRPLGVHAQDIPQAMVERERKFRIEQAMESGKPKEIAEKMVEGGMKKFFAEVALLEQKFVMDESRTIAQVVAPGTLERFLRWEVGEATA